LPHQLLRLFVSHTSFCVIAYFEAAVCIGCAAKPLNTGDGSVCSAFIRLVGENTENRPLCSGFPPVSPLSLPIHRRVSKGIRSSSENIYGKEYSTSG
jgi:hypothetical protein